MISGFVSVLAVALGGALGAFAWHALCAACKRWAWRIELAVIECIRLAYLVRNRFERVPEGWEYTGAGGDRCNRGWGMWVRSSTKAQEYGDRTGRCMREPWYTRAEGQTYYYGPRDWYKLWGVSGYDKHTSVVSAVAAIDKDRAAKRAEVEANEARWLREDQAEVWAAWALRPEQHAAAVCGPTSCEVAKRAHGRVRAK